MSDSDIDAFSLELRGEGGDIGLSVVIGEKHLRLDECLARLAAEGRPGSLEDVYWRQASHLAAQRLDLREKRQGEVNLIYCG